MRRLPPRDVARSLGLHACPAWLLAAFPLFVAAGCQSECQQLCDRMADAFARCGLTVTNDALQACYAEQAAASEVEERLCTAQTTIVLEENLRIRGGGDSSCLALEPYGAAAKSTRVP